MNDTQAAGGDAGISIEVHASAVAAARAEGEQAAWSRLNAAVGAEGVKGDARRTMAALDLLMKAPAMSGADVAAWVTDNIAATPVAGSVPDYVQRRASMHVAWTRPGAAPENGADGAEPDVIND